MPRLLFLSNAMGSDSIQNEVCSLAFNLYELIKIITNNKLVTWLALDTNILVVWFFFNPAVQALIERFVELPVQVKSEVGQVCLRKCVDYLFHVG